MIVYHVCGIKKFKKYLNGKIKAPIRAWKDIKSAERFSIQTGRRIILRLKFPINAKLLEGHRNEAVVLNEDYDMPKELIGVRNEIQKTERERTG